MAEQALRSSLEVTGIETSDNKHGAAARGWLPRYSTLVRSAATLLLFVWFPWLVAQAQSPATQSVTIEVNHEILPLGATDPDGTLEFTLTRNGAIADALEVNVDLTQERLWLSSSRLTQSVTFEAGNDEASFELTRSWFWEDNDDTLSNGFLTATIESGDNYSISGEPAATFIVGRREPLGIISLDMAEYTITEESGGRNVYVVATLVSGLDPSALANWFVSVSTNAGDTQNPNASSPEDYAPISETVRIEAKDYRFEGIKRIARVPVRVDLVDDEIYEPEERFKLILAQAPGFSANVFGLCTLTGTSVTCPIGEQEYPVTIAESDTPEQPFVRLNRQTLLEADDPDTDVDETSVRMTAGFKGGGVFSDDQTITLAFGGSAEFGADYTISPADADSDATNGYQLTLPAESRSTELTLTAVADSVESEAETIDISATLDFDDSEIGNAIVEVYEDAVSADDDATLKRLRLTSGDDYIALDGGFRGHVTSYTATANRIVDRVRIEVETTSPNASVSIAGDDDTASPGDAELDLQIGENLIEVTVTAGRGDTTTYRVRLTRLENLPVVTIEPVNTEVEEGEPVEFRIRLAERWPADVNIEVRGFETGARTLVNTIPVLLVNYVGGRDPVRVRSMAVEDDDWPEAEGAVIAQIQPRPDYYEIGNPAKAVVRILDDDGNTMRKPDIPQLFEVIPGDSQATLAWETPLSDGGSPITHYEYRVGHQSNSIKPGETGGEWVSTGSTDTSLLLTGLENNNHNHSNQSQYHFELRAVNALGAGIPVEAYARPWPRVFKPGAPRNLTAEADGAGGVVLRWDAPAADGGSPIVQYDYIVEQFEYSGNSWSSNWVSTSSADTGYTVTEREGRPLDHLSYHFRVRAVNSEGWGNFSTGVWAAASDTSKVSNQASRRLPEPPRISVADSAAREAPGAELEFEVSLDRAAGETVSVAYSTADGTAFAGEDYVPASGVLEFAPGEQYRTVNISVLEDAHDEGTETLTLTLSNVEGATMADSTATGAISNSDPMPKAWLAGFGRAASDQTAQAIGRRLESGTRESHLTIGGARVNDLFRRVQDDAPVSESSGPRLPGDLMNSSFYHSHDAGEESASQWTTWGESAASRFRSGDGPLSLNGEVSTAIMGLDSNRGNWLAGVALSLSRGEGDYVHQTAAGGGVSSSLTSVNPYVQFRLDERTSFWGTLGYGKGSLELAPENSETVLATGLGNTMAAFGGRSELTGMFGEKGNFELAVRSDVLLTSTRSDSIEGLIGTEASTRRARLLLEGSGTVSLANGGTLRPTFEAGLRHDAGDAETGMGLEIGGGLAFEQGRLAVEIDARTLIAHQADGYREWGLSASLRYQPGADGRGFGARFGTGWGASDSGMRNLWEMQDASALTAGDPLNSGGRMLVELGYGMGQDRLWYPYVAAERAGSGEQALRMGLRLNGGTVMNAGLEIGRRESAYGITEGAVMLQGSLQW